MLWRRENYEKTEVMHVAVSNVFIFVSEQVSKMGWGQLRKCVSFYEHKTLVHVS